MPKLTLVTRLVYQELHGSVMVICLEAVPTLLFHHIKRYTKIMHTLCATIEQSKAQLHYMRREMKLKNWSCCELVLCINLKFPFHCSYEHGTMEHDPLSSIFLYNNTRCADLRQLPELLTVLYINAV